MKQDADILAEFLIESHENLEQMERELLVLESEPGSTATIASIFRTIHTIKGTCGFLGFGRLEAVAHAGESLLSLLRDEELEYSSGMANGLLAMVDVIKEHLGAMRRGGKEHPGDNSAVIARLGRLAKGLPDDGPPRAATRAVPPVAPAKPRSASLCVVPVPAPAPPPKPTPQPTPPPPAATAAETSIRVDVALLDRLMNLVGELVLARNQILQFAASQSAATFLATVQRLNLITTDLQEGVMKTRMQPIGNVFSKFPRVVRDLAQACGKRVKVEISGEETELDRTLLEAIKDPLTHLVRNAVDHGVEPPAQRLARGKTPEGTVTLRAYHAGGQVNVEISDDGNGIDCARIAAKAVARGLVTAEQAQRMGERELLQFIFAPGFSTAEQVTKVSGRGVGMDVVRTNVERIGGTVDVVTHRESGTLFRVRIPLTLAIVPALIIASGGERYAIPQIGLVELVRLDADEAEKRIEDLNGVPVYRLRGSLLPLVRLGQVLGTGAQPSGAAFIVVVSADDQPFGIIVDDICDTADIVVKPLGAHLKGIGAFAGATILGDGRVALILDIMGVAIHAGVIGAAGRARCASGDAPEIVEHGAAEEALLVCRGPGDTRWAVRLAAVARLERIAAATVERVGAEEVVQYRGEIMPLVRIADLLPGGDVAEPGELLDVLVYQDRGRSIGLVVGEVLDIVHEQVALKRQSTRCGVAGSIVLRGRITELLDLEALIERAGLRAEEAA